MLNFYPGFIDNTNFRFINIDGKYIATICIINYPKKISFLEIIKSLPKDIQFDMSIFFKKQDTMKILKEITYNISSSKAEINTSSNNQIDADILDKLTSDAKKLRYEIQINNEQIYYTYTYISVKSDRKSDVLYNIKKLRNILYSKMFVSNVLNFRHLQGYLATLPLDILESSISNCSLINMTTSNVVNMFPFFTDTIFDKNGVILGYTENYKRIFNVDIFNNKYNNSNICIFGSSGSGKSYFVKLLILRLYITNVKQYVFDPEGEYVNLASEIGGECLSFNKSSNTFLNILDIDEICVLEENFLERKIRLVYDFLNGILNINMDCELYVYNAIKKAYLDKGIDDNVESMYIKSNSNKVYLNKLIKDAKYMPILEDVYINLKNICHSNNENVKTLVYNFKKMLIDYSFLNIRTTFNIDNELIVFNFSKIETKISNTLFKYIMDLIMKKINTRKEKSMIYIDEVWKFINESEFSAEQIFILFKTIRKSNAGIVTITQDISDFFNKNLGTYGKSIINNSFFKIFFKMEYSDTEILSKIGVLNLNELNEIARLKKGSMIISLHSNIINLDIKSNEYEDRLIKGDENYDSLGS
jgi:type IV secretory pathway VirB4 component